MGGYGRKPRGGDKEHHGQFDVMAIYNRMPVGLQNAACCLEGYRIKKDRFGRTFWNKLKEYEARNGWSYDKLCEFRDQRLRDMARHCYLTVPYYTKLFDEAGIDYRNIRRLDDLKKLPLLDKQTVLKNFDLFLSTEIPDSKKMKTHTSGTTGSGFVFYTMKEAVSEQWAAWWRYRRRLGIECGTWCALFGGRSVVPTDRGVPPYSRMNTPNRQEYFSTYHMSPQNMGWYLNEIKDKGLRWIHGYPSAIGLLADYILENQIEYHGNIDYITTGAENLLDAQKEKIMKAFGVYPYNHYGMAEGVANFSENKNKEMYVDEDFAAVEFLENGSGSYKVIGTTLTNYAMPLLRYDTKDIATYCETDCGRRILSLDGRQEDYVVLRDGTRIGRLDHIFKDLVNIKEAQIVQDKIGEIKIKVVRGSSYTDLDEQRLPRECTERLKKTKIKIEYANQIERTKSGKMRFVVSNLK